MKYIIGILLATLIMSCEQSEVDNILPSQESDESKSNQEENINDRSISTMIEEQLDIDNAVPLEKISVSVLNGTVTLEGTVNNLYQKNRTVYLTGLIKGVRSIIDMIKVDPVKRTDKQIREQIEKNYLFDPIVETWEIQPEVQDGVVTLSGNVGSYAEKKLVEKITAEVAGVKAINNKIKINYNEDRTDIAIKEEIKDLIRRNPFYDEELITVTVDNGAVKLSGIVGSYTSKFNLITDAWIRGVTEVKATDLTVATFSQMENLKKKSYIHLGDDDITKYVRRTMIYDPRVSIANIDISVNNSVVILEGTVLSLRAKKAAQEDAEKTAGVTYVINLLKVEQPEKVDDETITSRITNKIMSNQLLNQYDITAIVNNGKVSLTGTVSFPYEKSVVNNIISSINGVMEIENNISVKEMPVQKTDEKIKAQIEKDLLWKQNILRPEIAIAVENGIVTLTGNVYSYAGYKNLINSAFKNGATSVKSNVTIMETHHRSYHNKDAVR